MAPKLAIDDSLLVEAQGISGLKTKKDTVNLALKEFIQQRRQAEIVELFGKIEYVKDYDYKKMRSRK